MSEWNTALCADRTESCGNQAGRKLGPDFHVTQRGLVRNPAVTRWKGRTILCSTDVLWTNKPFEQNVIGNRKCFIWMSFNKPLIIQDPSMTALNKPCSLLHSDSEQNQINVVPRIICLCYEFLPISHTVENLVVDIGQQTFAELLSKSDTVHLRSSEKGLRRYQNTFWELKSKKPSNHICMIMDNIRHWMKKHWRYQVDAHSLDAEENWSLVQASLTSISYIRSSGTRSVHERLMLGFT